MREAGWWCWWKSTTRAWSEPSASIPLPVRRAGRAALTAIRKARFKPYTRNGVAYAAKAKFLSRNDATPSNSRHRGRRRGAAATAAGGVAQHCRPPTRCTAPPRAARRLGAARGHAGHGLPHFVAQSDFVGKTLFVILILMSLVTQCYLILVKVASNVSMRNARSTS